MTNDAMIELCRTANGQAANLRMTSSIRTHRARSFTGDWQWAVAALALGLTTAPAQPFLLPTANRAIFEPGGEERFFVGTVGKPWMSGTFGCVRTEGWQLHEGLDIRCLERDKRNEPMDPVHAASDGTVAYINRRPALSNYGNY